MSHAKFNEFFWEQDAMVNSLETALQVRKRDGRVTEFNRDLISRAMAKAFCAEKGLADVQKIDSGLQQKIEQMTDEVVAEILQLTGGGNSISVEKVQDLVEAELMRAEFFSVARRYILYRNERAKMRQLRSPDAMQLDEAPTLTMLNGEGQTEALDMDRLRSQVDRACEGLSVDVDRDLLSEEISKQIYNGITNTEIARAMVLAARAKIERDPKFDKVAGRLVLNIIYRESLGKSPKDEDVHERYRDRFPEFVQIGIDNGRLSPELASFDLARLADAIVAERDEKFPYLGLQTIYDRYLLHINGRRFEAPQYFWMRVAMGLAINEGEQKNDRAIEFYNLLSTFRFTSATPTLFNSGTLHPQLSSCYLSTVGDDLDSIFKAISDNAKLSKWAGGLGNDWTNIRATNAHIKGTNGQSQGVIPFLKVVSDTAVAVNQGGKRKGAVCSYLESWHLDIEEFLDLRKNTGDDRRRTHDMHTANWIPDLFMKRVVNNQDWTLFSPNDTPDLHDLVGQAFERRYEEYEQMARDGKIALFRTLPAMDLWRKMLTRLFETGHPWITFKDPSNIRSPQDHVGVVHSSNLCTEILLNTSADEIAVCNLGSINMLEHIQNGQLDLEMLKETVATAVRMLDNVIDINYYPTPEAKNSNGRHRPVGLGLMGFQDALGELGFSYASNDAVEFADRSMEAISYFAILASSKLAKERGPYSTYKGSKWDRGLLPMDTIELLEQERGWQIDMDRSSTLDWQVVRDHVRQFGMRNSNVMAIAPTATISTIIGVTQSIEPTYKHLFAKSNLSGEFVQVNIKLVNELQARDLWCDELLEAIKYYDGSLGEIPGLPQDIKDRYATSFEIDPKWLIECASRRQKWIDMGQSLNLYLDKASGKRLDDMYRLAWQKGMKTTYYLRTLGATNVEKSTVDINKYGVQPRWMKNKSASGDVKMDRQIPSAVAESNPADFQISEAQPEVKACRLDDPDCEACQ
ncbi:MAG: ribonucleoside-diphosphate reductase subunit alpha [Pirellulaceae bacterium]